MGKLQGKTEEPQYIDFVPKLEWTEDTEKHVLSLQIPGFTKEEFRVELGCSGKVAVHGQRPLGGRKCARFHQVFQAPENSNFDGISGRVEPAKITLNFPKIAVQKEEKPQERPMNSGLLDNVMEKIDKIAVQKEEKPQEIPMNSGLLDNVMEKINKKKVIIAAAVTSISIGLIVFHSMRKSAK